MITFLVVGLGLSCIAGDQMLKETEKYKDRTALWTVCDFVCTVGIILGVNR